MSHNYSPYTFVFVFCCIFVSCQQKHEIDPIVEPNIVSVTGVTLSPDSLFLYVGESESLTVQILPSNANNKTIQWFSDNPCVSVSVYGTVTAVSPGSATVTVRTDDGGFEAKCNVVSEKRTYPVTSISLDKAALELRRGESATLVATIEPNNATNKNVKWLSSNPEIVSVNNGVLYANDKGQASITVESEDGSFMATCEVSVSISVIDLSANGTANSYIISSGGDYIFNASVKGNTIEPIQGISSVGVLWESFGTSEPISNGDIIRDISLNDGYISLFIPSGAKNGNALIAVMNASNEILWSWHIWFCSGYDPTATQQTYANDAGIMMDRNLGATSSIPGSVEALGLMYQWGRKDPFMGADGINSKVFAKSSIDFPKYVTSSPTIGTIDYTIKNPMTYIIENRINYEWFYPTGDSSMNERWKEDEKTVYDPCPPGWRVPGKDIWEKAGVVGKLTTDKNKWDNKNLGVTLDKAYCQPDAWYPATGIIYSYNGEFYGSGWLGQYLSSTLVYESVTQDMIYLFDSSGNYGVTQMSMGHASSVRCLKVQ